MKSSILRLKLPFKVAQKIDLYRGKEVYSLGNRSYLHNFCKCVIYYIKSLLICVFFRIFILYTTDFLVEMSGTAECRRAMYLCDAESLREDCDLLLCAYEQRFCNCTKSSASW